MTAAWRPTRSARRVSVPDPRTVPELLATRGPLGYDEPVRLGVVPTYGLAVCECGASARSGQWVLRRAGAVHSVVFPDDGRPPCQHWTRDPARR